MRGVGRPGIGVTMGVALALGLVVPLRASGPADSIDYECSAQVTFTLPGPNGAMPVFKYPLEPKRPRWQWPAGAQGPETVNAEARVDADGNILNLHLYWMQSGLMSWPQGGRADLDDVLLYVRFGEGYVFGMKAPRTQFDPALLAVDVEALETRKMKRPRLLMLRKDWGDEPLGGLADIPPWLRSATIHLRWEELKRFAGDRKSLNFSIEEVVFRGGQFHHDPIRGGTLDLSVMPAVIERFREAEALVKAKVADRKAQCRQAVAGPPELGPDSEI